MTEQPGSLGPQGGDPGDQRPGVVGVAARAVTFAEAEGLIVRSVIGDVITISPPLIISAAEVDSLFDRLTRALDKTMDWVTRERLAQS